MSEFVNTIDLLGDGAVCDAIIEGTLEEFCDDVLTKLHENAFRELRYLTYANLPNLLQIDYRSFNGCNALTRLILSSETMCTLTNTEAFGSTPIKSGTGYIYVPRALLSDEDATKDYRRATNWSTFANQFRALEDYTVDGTVTGELDESKI